MGTRPRPASTPRLESPRHQVKYWLLHSGPDHRGARAFGVSRHASKRRLPHGRDVSVGRVHSQRTMAAYLRVATAFAEWCHERHGIKSVPEQLKHAEWAQEWLDERGLAPATRAGYLSALPKLVEVVCPGRRQRWLSLRDELPGRRAPGNRAWPPEDVNRLVAHVAARDSELGLILRVLDATGLRVGEVVRHPTHWHHALHAGQVRDDHLWVIGKGGKERVVSLPPALARELAARAAGREPSALLFDATSRRLYHRVGRVCAELGIRRDGPHALRYSYAQRERERLLAQGLEPAEADRLVSERLGHARRRITRLYTATRSG